MTVERLFRHWGGRPPDVRFNELLRQRFAVVILAKRDIWLSQYCRFGYPRGLYTRANGLNLWARQRQLRRFASGRR